MTRGVRKRAGIKEVARVAGVSVTTVSHALNGKGRLTEETRERVRQVATELGYRPNSTARNLVGRRTGLLGLSVSPLSGASKGLGDFEYFTQLMLGATTTAMELGCALVLTSPHQELGTDIAVDGAIVVDPVPGDPLLRQLRAGGIPVVSTGRDLDDPGFVWWVDNDHASGARSVLDHLARRGARRTALLTNPTKFSYTHDTERAYVEWCEQHRVKPLIRYARKGLTESEGYAATSKLLALPEPPDAIYATYGRLAFGAAMAAEARDVRVPDDLMIVMTATEAAAASTSPVPLTAVNLHPDRLGHQAAELLVALIEGKEPTPPPAIPTRIVTRTSTRRPAVAHVAR